jgi:hypothetical protein
LLDPDDVEVSWMLNYLEDRFFTYSPGWSLVQLDEISTDWFNLGGFAKLQPYYVHYQDAYLQRDQIPNFLRGFFNTLAALSDPQTLTFMESLEGGQPNKTHEEGWFFHQLRAMLLMELGDDLYLARATPREWLQQGKRIAAREAPTYFGEVSYEINSFADEGRIEATVKPPARRHPANLYLRLRHAKQFRMDRVTIQGRDWKDFDPAKEWIRLPSHLTTLNVVAYYPFR